MRAASECIFGIAIGVVIAMALSVV